MNVSYEPAARTEVADALNWYLSVAGQTIADSFERELDKAVRLLRRFRYSARRGCERAADCDSMASLTTCTTASTATLCGYCPWRISFGRTQCKWYYYNQFYHHHRNYYYHYR